MEQIQGDQKLSYGIVMILETTVIITLLGHLMYLTKKKMKKLNHAHVTWPGGQIFLAYLSLVVGFNLFDGSSIYYSYLLIESPVSLYSVVCRVSGKTLLMLAKICIWYYTINHDFDLFKQPNSMSKI